MDATVADEERSRVPYRDVPLDQAIPGIRKAADIVGKGIGECSVLPGNLRSIAAIIN
jgi:hypothetical protein